MVDGHQEPESLGSILRRVATSYESLPNESQCSACGYFNAEHPEVQRIFRERNQAEVQTMEDKLTLALHGRPSTRTKPPEGRNWFEMGKCKCEGREAQVRAADNFRWQNGNLPTGAQGPRAFDTFRAVDGTEAMHEAARRFARGEGPSILTLQGPKGSGKSHHLEAIVRHGLEAGLRCRYETASELLNRLQSTYRDDSDDDLTGLLAWYHSMHILALDEVGLQRATEWRREQLHTLIDYRLRHGSRLVVATMKTKDELAENIGEALASRLCSDREELGEVALVSVVASDYRQSQL